MQTNMGNPDLIIRAIVGVAALMGALALGVSSLGGILLLVVGGILAVTAAVGFCPLYRVFGMNTCPAPKRSSRRWSDGDPRGHGGRPGA